MTLSCSSVPLLAVFCCGLGLGAMLPTPCEAAVKKENAARQNATVLSSASFHRRVDEQGGRVDFVFGDDAPFAECHASTMVQIADGSLLCAWFGGTKEKNPDVGIWTARFDGQIWSKPERTAKVSKTAHWNPVLFRDPRSKTVYLFFKVGVDVVHWRTYWVQSNDGGARWSKPVELVPGDVGGRGPVKNQPIVLADGSWLAPASTEKENGRRDVWRAFADRSRDHGKTWQRSDDFAIDADLHGPGAIQPTFWQSAPGKVHALMRTGAGALWRADSSDNGATWSKVHATNLPNNNSGIDALRLDDGRVLLVYNPVGTNWGPRTPLDLAVSRDNGKTWHTIAHLEDDPDHESEYSYPTIIRTRDGIAICYTWKRKRIRCWQIPLAALSAHEAKRPNVVLIMADDMGYECVGANGSTFYKTPNLDRLAAGGMRFVHAYSQPICTPSRVEIMTGRYNARNYVRFGYLHPAEITFGNVMRAAGYQTGIAGKWQLKGGFEGPRKFGFDDYCLWYLTRRPPRYANPGLEINGREFDFPGKYGPDLVSDHLVKFIQANRDRPFFAYYPMLLPHWPFQPTPDSKDWDPTETRPWPRSKWDRPHFRDMVAYADKMVGKIDRALKEAGVRENTLLIFTCDNGTYRSITSPFKGRLVRGGKGTTPNAGTHVPLIASWPGTIKPGQVSSELIDFSDLLPTLAEIGGAELPGDRAIDGRSFLPQLKGEPGNPRDWVFCWYERDGKRDGNVKRYARNQTYKLYHDGRFYDVPADELEKNNLKPDQLNPQAKQVRAQLQIVLDRMVEAEKQYSYGPAGGKRKKTKKKKQG